MRRAPLLFAVCLAGCSAGANPTPPERPARFVQVIDGDTIRVRGERVRISNIDAPEMPPAAKCWGEAGLALSAASRLEGFINISHSIQVARSGKDQYGRTLARVLVDGHDIGEVMIEQGLASAWMGKRWDWCAPMRYNAEGAPGLTSNGPEGNAAYWAWAGKRIEEQSVTGAR